MKRRAYWLLSLTLGIAVGAVTYGYLISDGALAVSSGLLWFAGIGLTIRNHAALKNRLLERTGSGPFWWDGSVGPLVVLVGSFGIGPTLPVSFGLRVALLILTTGALLVAWNLGVGSTLSKLDATAAEDA